MSYKVYFDRAFKIISSLQPKFIFINGIDESRRDEYSLEFTSLGYNLIKLKNIIEEDEKEWIFNDIKVSKINKPIFLDQIKERIIKMGSVKTIIVGYVENPYIIDFFFPDDFSYIYVYPNNWDSIKDKIKDYQNLKNIKKKNFKLYNNHIKYFDNHIFTILE